MQLLSLILNTFILVAALVSALPTHKMITAPVGGPDGTPLLAGRSEIQALEKRAGAGVSVCQNFNGGQPCSTFVFGILECKPIMQSLAQTISSVRPDSLSKCEIFTSSNCSTGGSGLFGSPGKDLTGPWSGWNHNVNSINCAKNQ